MPSGIFRKAMNTFLFEMCTENLEAAEVAEAAGAGRIELCIDLAVGGITPGADLIETTVRALQIPVHVLIRPRGGDFCYSSEDFARMRSEVETAKAAGAHGLALGILREDGRIDTMRTRELVELASPMKVTFHRAFDDTPNLAQALEDVIGCGADCLLTSGGAPNVLAGAEAIARLREQAGSRLEIMAGGGLRLETLVEVVRRTGVTHLHGSMLRRHAHAEDSGPNGMRSRTHHARVPRAELEADVREAIRLFETEVASRAQLPRTA